MISKCADGALCHGWLHFCDCNYNEVKCWQ